MYEKHQIEHLSQHTSVFVCRHTLYGLLFKHLGVFIGVEACASFSSAALLFPFRWRVEGVEGEPGGMDY